MRRTEDGYPIAECYRDGIHWVIPVCPFCGKKHLHGYADGNASDRVAHCVKPGPHGVYWLAPVAGLAPDRERS